MSEAAKQQISEAELEAMSIKSLGRIAKARSSLILSNPFFGALSLRLRPKAVVLMAVPGGVRLMTMATDGFHLYYNPLWLETISDSELKGVYCHEVLHCALGHMYRRGERDPLKWNIAADGAINRMVLACGMKLPVDAVGFESFENITAEEYEAFNSEQLYSRVKPQPPQPKGSGGGGDGDLPWGAVLDAPAVDGDGRPIRDQESGWRVATIQAAQIAKLHGKLPSGLESLINEVTRNRVDWKSYLRKFLQSAMRNDYDWKRPAPRYLHSGLYLPHLHDESVPPIVVVGDTSGSCWNDQAKFFAELQAIIDDVKPEAVHFMQVDADVADYRVLLPGDPIALTVRGGGGTSFVPPFEKVKELGIEPAAFIYLTDMYGAFPDEAPDYPVLWASTTKDVVAPFGETLYLGDD